MCSCTCGTRCRMRVHSYGELRIFIATDGVCRGLQVPFWMWSPSVLSTCAVPKDGTARALAALAWSAGLQAPMSVVLADCKKLVLMPALRESLCFGVMDPSLQRRSLLVCYFLWLLAQLARLPTPLQ